MTDQVMMKNAREEMKKLQKKMRQQKDNPKKLMEIQKKMLSYNKDIMMQSFRPLLVTFIPIIIIFGWINMHMVYFPIAEDEVFSVDVEMRDLSDIRVVADNLTILERDNVSGVKEATFAFSGPAGFHDIAFSSAGITETIQVQIGTGEYYSPKNGMRSPFKRATVNLQRLEMLPLGFTNLTGFGTYIIFTIVFSLLLRKLLKVA